MDGQKERLAERTREGESTPHAPYREDLGNMSSLIREASIAVAAIEEHYNPKGMSDYCNQIKNPQHAHFCVEKKKA
ncbi:hypothetical protein JZ751_005887, partial [Albula glossodonta]